MSLHMNYLRIIVALFLIHSLFSCENNKVDSTNAPSQNRLVEKHIPSDEFFLQRAYPDRKFNFNAYEKALKDVKQTSLNRSNIPDGFDTPWTVQGPGNIGARINVMAVHPTNEAIIYAGFSQGGLWKTTDGGINWKPIFDDQVFLAIGEIVLDPNNPDIVYVGTGDPNISGYPFIGDGIYRSLDAGETWQHLGLTDQRIISKISIDPSDSNTIYVASMGLPFERNEERGLYKSMDGGQTWNQILFINNETGITDLIMDTTNPSTLYAATWTRIRNNQESLLTSTEAKIYKTTDGGETWDALSGGLPQEKMCRIGLAISEQNTDHLFAIYVDTTYQLHHIYKSIDAGMNWDTLNTSSNSGMSDNALGGFGWYFAKIAVNPNDEDDIFLLGVDLWRSVDGGQSWDLGTPPWWQYDVHADKHDLVFGPNESIFLGTDGGAYKTTVFGEEWTDIENIPTTQFYRVAYNPHLPELYYGGAQDNGTTDGNAETINDWGRIYGGDGFQTRFNPDNSNIMYAETQRGNIVYSSNGGINFQGGTDGIGEEDRNWDMPYIISPHNSYTLYTGTNQVYRTTVAGQPEWESISEDLTDSDTTISRYHNITTIDESPLVEGLLYVGTGDANVHRSDDGGLNWLPIFDSLPNHYVTAIHASPINEDVVFVSHSGYRNNDNTARIHRSDDRGENWYSIAGDLPDIAINDVLVLPNYQDSVLFVATDGGVYASINAGEDWDRLGDGMPIVPVYDIEWNEYKNEVFAGTFARSIMSFPLDSIGLVNDIDVATSPTIKPIEKLNIFPNPATSYIQVEFNNPEAHKSTEIVILDIQGRLIEQTTLSPKGNVSHQFDVSNYASGQYFVKAKIRHTIYTGRFMVQ